VHLAKIHVKRRQISGGRSFFNRCLKSSILQICITERVLETTHPSLHQRCAAGTRAKLWTVRPVVHGLSVRESEMLGVGRTSRQYLVWSVLILRTLYVHADRREQGAQSDHDCWPTEHFPRKCSVGRQLGDIERSAVVCDGTQEGRSSKTWWSARERKTTARDRRVAWSRFWRRPPAAGSLDVGTVPSLCPSVERPVEDGYGRGAMVEHDRIRRAHAPVMDPAPVPARFGRVKVQLERTIGVQGAGAEPQLLAEGPDERVHGWHGLALVADVHTVPRRVIHRLLVHLVARRALKELPQFQQSRRL
jgi:hypothetical protein